MITPTPRGIVCGGYSNHSDLKEDQWGNLYGVFVQSTDGQWPSLIIRRRQRGTGAWTTISELRAKVGVIKYGYASIAIVGAHLVLVTPERQPDGSTPQREYLIENAVAEFA